MRLYVVDPHPIFRRGLVTSLLALDPVRSVGEASAVIAAQDDPACAQADLMLIDGRAPEAIAFVGRFTSERDARAIVIGTALDAAQARLALRAGAAGVLAKESMTTETLASAVLAASQSTNVVISAPLDHLLAAEQTTGTPAPALSPRERRVLELLSEGSSIRQVAEELHYSERTVKTVVRTSVAKLNARSRSQAIAEAVRSGLI